MLYMYLLIIFCVHGNLCSLLMLYTAFLCSVYIRKEVSKPIRKPQYPVRQKLPERLLLLWFSAI